MRRCVLTTSLTIFALSACDAPKPAPTTPEARAKVARAKEDASPRRAPNLAAARKAHGTKIVRKSVPSGPMPTPPSGHELVRYPSDVGELGAYTAYSGGGDGGKVPAVVYVLGGFSNGVGATPWAPAPRENDQSGRAFVEEGLMVMWPSRRGSHDNPGHKEGFYGEVDDVLAAREWLAKRPEVDPDRIYLVGHSTGAVVALLAAASSEGAFRGIFAIGAVDDPAVYGAKALVYDTTDPDERRLRAPGEWLHAIRDPTYVIEGELGKKGAQSIERMRSNSENPNVRFAIVPGLDHFSVLRPATEAIAGAIRSDDGEGAFGAELTPESLAKGSPGR